MPSEPQTAAVPPITFQYACRASELGVRNLLIDLRRQIQACQVEADVGSAIEIALAEALNNIVEHGCADCPGAPIRVEMSLDTAHVFVQLSDPGSELPVKVLSKQPGKNLNVARDALPEGGFGWGLIHMLTDHMDYTRINGENRLKLWFSQARDGH